MDPSFTTTNRTVLIKSAMVPWKATNLAANAASQSGGGL